MRMIPRMLAQMISIEAMDLAVWCLKTLHVPHARALEWFEETWKRINSSDTIEPGCVLLNPEAISRAVIAEALGTDFTIEAATKLLAELKTKRTNPMSDTDPEFQKKLGAELAAIRAIAVALEPLRAQAMLHIALQFDPIPMDYESQLHLLRVANGRSGG